MYVDKNKSCLSFSDMSLDRIHEILTTQLKQPMAKTKIEDNDKEDEA